MRKFTRYPPAVHSMSQEKHRDQEKNQDQEEHQEQDSYFIYVYLLIISNFDTQ